MDSELWRRAIRLPCKASALLAGALTLAGFAGLAGVAGGADGESYAFGVEGPHLLHGPAGGVAKGTFYVTARGTEDGPGAEGWSLALAATGGRIAGITLSGTFGNWAHAGGSETTLVVGDAAALSIVSLPSAIRLEPGTLRRIAAIEVEADAPPSGEVRHDAVRLEFVDALAGPGGPVSNEVLRDGRIFSPTFEAPAFSIRLVEDAACPDYRLAFTTALTESPVPFDGVAGGERARGEVVIPVPPGETGARSVFVNLVTSFEDPRPPDQPFTSGWAFSVSLEGEASCMGATVEGTIMDRYGGGFSTAECADPSRNFGRRGAVGAFVQLFFDPFINIPPVGTYSVLEIRLAADGPQGAADKVARLRFEDGLAGGGTPVTNTVGLDGGAVFPCNTFEAELTLRFREDPGLFVRGDPNGDGQVDISDAVWTLGELFLGTEPSSCPDAADSNDDGRVDISDAVSILAFQFLGGAPMPPPYPECGADSEEPRDDLRCFSQPRCR